MNDESKEYQVRISCTDHGDFYIGMYAQPDESLEQVAAEAKKILVEAIAQATCDIVEVTNDAN